MFGCWENVEKQRKIDFFFFLFWYVLWIYTWFWVFFFFLLVFRCWENVGKQKEIVFFSLIYLISKKLETTESQPNQTNWNLVSSVLIFLPYGSVSVPNLVKLKILVQWKNCTSNRSITPVLLVVRPPINLCMPSVFSLFLYPSHNKFLSIWFCRESFSLAWMDKALGLSLSLYLLGKDAILVKHLPKEALVGYQK